MDNPLVSIIIPNYNHAQFLDRRSDSVFNQTYQNFEVILLDDASTDKSLEILNNYKNHPKVSYFIVNNENSGSPFKQWKKGIELAQGEYIWIAESDDYCELEFLKESILAFSKHDKIGMVASPLKIVEGTKFTKEINVLPSGVFDGSNIIREKLSRGNIFYNASSVVFKKNLIPIKALSKIIDFKICGDWWLWIQILRLNDLAYLNMPLSTYRKHPNATTNNLLRNQIFYQEVFKLLRKIKNFSKANGIPKENIFYWILKIRENQKFKLSTIGLILKFVFLLPIQDQFKYFREIIKHSK